MTLDLTPAIAAYLARNRGPTPENPASREQPNYGVSARLDGQVIELNLSFFTGSAYCCYENGCHLDLSKRKRWERLRQELAARGVSVPERLELRLAVIVEAGALFFDYRRPIPGHRRRYELSPSKAVRYQAVITEADNQDPQKDFTPDQTGSVGLS